MEGDISPKTERGLRLLNESLVKYLAGLLDADGSLSFAFKRDPNRPDRCFVGLTLRLTSSSAVDKRGFVEKLPHETGFGSVSKYGDCFTVWDISKRADLEMLIPRLTKHMIIKAQHWNWLLETWRTLRADGKTVSWDEREKLTAESKISRQTRIGPLKPKNHPTWAWVAGYLDGDGWYNYRKHYSATTGYWQWTISVGVGSHVNDAIALQFLQKAFDGTVRDGKQNMKVWRRNLGYQNRSFALHFLSKLARHSRLKREKIDAIIHHHQQRLSVPGTERKYCSEDGCEAPAHGRGLCHLHYQRAYRSERCKRQSDAA